MLTLSCVLKAFSTTDHNGELAETASRVSPQGRRLVIEIPIAIIYFCVAIFILKTLPNDLEGFWFIAILCGLALPLVIIIMVETSGGTAADQDHRFACSWMLVQSISAHDRAIWDRVEAGQSNGAIAEWLSSQVGQTVIAEDVDAYRNAVIERRVADRTESNE